MELQKLMSYIDENLKSSSGDELVESINKLREVIHNNSPFKSEPVDFVMWVKNKNVHANDYNPNSVAPPEMELLRLSIDADGYTQPIVTMEHDGLREVIDGFHRHRVGKECADIQSRIHGYLPVVQIRSGQTDKANRMASTVRHNRARGKHKVEAMSDMVIELKRRNWSDTKICKELGMDQDEVLRLCQISGLSEIFANQEFSKSWEPVGNITPEDILSGDENDYINSEISVKTANTDDKNRIFHTFDKWECLRAGFYETTPPKKGMTKEDCMNEYVRILSNHELFEKAIIRVLNEWVNSCEHYLTNSAMNRIAWLGQASVCIETGVPADYSSGWFLLSDDQQNKANMLALKYLNKWLNEHGIKELTIEEALTTRQAEVY